MNAFRLIACMALLCLASLFIQPASAQGAFTITDDSRLLSGHLELGDGEIIKFKSRSGELFTIHFEGDSRGYGIVMTLDEDDSSPAFEILVLAIEEHSSGAGQTMRQVDRVQGEVGGSAVGLMPSPLAAVKVDAISLAEVEPAELSRQDLIRKALQTGTNPDQESVCCVTCGNTTACGCAIVMDCGSCCSGGCCGGGGGQGPLSQSP
ncbi:MAG: hypothetical protein AAGD01_14940 [Acidobacteriota bacterium]